MSHLAVISAAWLLSGLATAAERQPPPLAVAPFDAAEAKRHQQAWAEYLGVPVEITNSIGVRLILIPPGEYLMGLPASDEQRHENEIQHRVRITKPFYLGMFEVTQGQWERLMGSNPSWFQGAEHPVDMVSWQDCQEFLRRLNGLSGERHRVYRLPTEAEWEHACRAGSTGGFGFGDLTADLADYAWYAQNSGDSTHPVGLKLPNAWELYDMHGNAWEWCQDWYDSDYHASSPMDDPQGPPRGSYRVLRGGSWDDEAAGSRASFRYGYVPGHRYDFHGFRLAMTVSCLSQ